MVDVDDFIAKARDPKTVSVIMRREKAVALADEIERLRGWIAKAVPMLDRLAFYEGNINQPAKAHADEMRTTEMPRAPEGAGGGERK